MIPLSGECTGTDLETRTQSSSFRNFTNSKKVEKNKKTRLVVTGMIPAHIKQ